MSNIYESPQTSTARRQVFVQSDVTERMVNGIGRGKKWAKYIAYMSIFYGVLSTIGAIGITSAVALGGFGPFLTDLFGETASISQTYIFILALVLLVLVVLIVYYFIMMGRAMLRYSRASYELSDSHDFADLETCYDAFTTFNRYTVYLAFIFIALIAAMSLVGNAFLDEFYNIN